MKPFLGVLALLFITATAVPRHGKPKHRLPRTESSQEAGAEVIGACPSDGYFADAEQCDKYYECIDGEMIEKLCPDGMVFNDFDPDMEKCDLPFNIDCSSRPKLQDPIPTLNCPRLNGYFAHENPKECGIFYYCVDGKFNKIVCPDGLVYNDRTGICSWPDEAKKKGCGASEVFNFDCPPVNETFGQTHPRYPDPEDCQYFYVCINGLVPRRSGCKLGQVFDDYTKKCEWSRLVPECADWYKDRLSDAELEALENPPTPKPRPLGVQSRRKVVKHKIAVVEEDIHNDEEIEDSREEISSSPKHSIVQSHRF